MRILCISVHKFYNIPKPTMLQFLLIGFFMVSKTLGTECTKQQSCGACDLTTGKCAQVCRYNYYWSSVQSKCQPRINLIDECISYEDSFLDNGKCTNCLIGYTLYTKETSIPFEFSCERSYDLWTCFDHCSDCAVVERSNGWQKYCLGCEIGYKASQWDPVNK